MPKYRFTIINIDDVSDESVGVAESRDMPTLIFKLTNSGYAVKDIRLATNDDIMIFNLKKFRNRLSGVGSADTTSEKYVVVRPVSHWFRNTLVCVVVFICILFWLFWR